ncbi:hypothetical protein ACFYT4_28245 [Streptomyces sp. NPDC004609]|uniref:hypothetical protein n=1 Tax=Streptomyces sp. NPDC004609 TaxID=3364704 RepID=UPI00367FCECF
MEAVPGHLPALRARARVRRELGDTAGALAEVRGLVELGDRAGATEVLEEERLPVLPEPRELLTTLSAF